MIGFRQLNKSEADDGFKMLPLHLQTALKSQTPSSFCAQQMIQHPMLMHLRHGELNYRNSANAAKDKEDDEDTVNVEPRTQPFWCQYPPPLLIGGGRSSTIERCGQSIYVTTAFAQTLAWST
ncbi:hypothetical protein MHU86_14962 [Fragilaria crotonensis]|nr:hypothetical protein MHU86_14962 [Fragilaria crotonensis]